MKARPILGLVLRQFNLMRSSPVRVIPLFAWVAIDIVLWGFITRFLNTIGAAGLDFVPLLLGAVLFWDFFTRVMQGITTAFFEDLWARNFLNVFATPLTISEYVSGLVLTTTLTSIIGLAVMLLLAITIFGLPFLSYGLAVVPFLLVLFLFGVALGIFASGIVLRFGPASEWLVWPIPALLSPFAGVFYPLDTLPGWMQMIGLALPPAYVFEGLRSIVSDEGFDAGRLAWSVALALGHIVLAGWFFRSVYRHAVRSGLLARYSAESVG